MSAELLDGLDPGEVHAFLARKVEGIGQQWLDITDDGALIVCARARLESPDHFDPDHFDWLTHLGRHHRPQRHPRRECLMP